MRPGALGEVGLIRFIRKQSTMLLLATYAEPCVATLHTAVPLPGWPNQAANEADYFGPIDHT